LRRSGVLKTRTAMVNHAGVAATLYRTTRERQRRARPAFTVAAFA
jgi:hypothetical protein